MSCSQEEEDAGEEVSQLLLFAWLGACSFKAGEPGCISAVLVSLSRSGWGCGGGGSGEMGAVATCFLLAAVALVIVRGVGTVLFARHARWRVTGVVRATSLRRRAPASLSWRLCVGD